jgi:hypothetical protein
MTIGAEMSPRATRSLKSAPALSRSPYPSQQIRAGSPWKAIFSRAPRIHFWRRSLSGKSFMTAWSVTSMSLGSPESAAHRNGPLPSQKSGRMYAGTKPGNSNARS